MEDPPRRKRKAEETVNWVDCDGNCGKWYNVDCMPLNVRNVRPEESSYRCDKCRKKVGREQRERRRLEAEKESTVNS